jgi:hypothetical protein
MTMPRLRWNFVRRAGATLALAASLGCGLRAAVAAEDARAHLQPDPVLYQRACDQPANPVVRENCRLGTGDWFVETPGQIEGYGSADSVNVGGTLDFYVNTSAAAFDLLIYRIGYYGGLGGRLIAAISELPGHVQGGCARAADTGLFSCSNWLVSYRLRIPQDWVSGVYLGKLVRADDGGANYVLFVVRDDDRPAAILYQQSFATYHAYNNYGGKSTYYWNSDSCLTVTRLQRAAKVSFNRPYSGAMEDPSVFFRAEYPFVRWLEANGYDLVYSTTQDTHRSGKPGAKNRLLDYAVFLSVGHDEYWSQEMRDAMTAARDAGVHLGFFTGNTGYWRIRFEPDPITHEPDSVLVTYKTTQSGPPDPSGHPTTTWRDPAGVNDPEAKLLGAHYIGDNDYLYFPLRVTAEQAQDPTFRHTGLDQMPPNTYINIGDQIVGWEWDAVPDPPPFAGIKILAASPVYGEILTDAGNSFNNRLDGRLSHVSRYVAASGARVFNAGTIQWSWGLGAQGVNPVPPDPIITQVTYNVLADMGVQPVTPSRNIILDSDIERQPPRLDPQRFIPVGSSQNPVISNIQTAVTEQAVTISWETDVEANGQAWVGSRSGHLDEAERTPIVYAKKHRISFTNLLPNTTYYYRVTAINRDWEFTIADERQFQTASNARLQVEKRLEPHIRRARCWLNSNAPLTIAIGVLVASIATATVWRIWVMWRRGIAWL